MRSLVILITINLWLEISLTGTNGQAGRAIAAETVNYPDFTAADFEEDEGYPPSELKGVTEKVENSLNHLPTTEGYGKISGGHDALVGAFPYQVGLIMHKMNGSVTWCGGALISDQFVLTAAHCMRRTKAVTVILGAHDRLNSTEPGQVRQNVTSSNLFSHPNYTERWIRDDIGLIRLNDKLDFTPQIQPIALPDGIDLFDGRNGTVSGWGYYDGQLELARNLRYTPATVISNSICQKRFGKNFNSANVCLDGRKIGNTCKGDSGGPFAVESANDGTPILVGLVSFGVSKGCLKRLPFVMTRVSSHLKWIEENTGISSPR